MPRGLFRQLAGSVLLSISLVASLAVIERLGPWPVQPLVARHDLPRHLVDAVRDAILGANDNPDVAAALRDAALTRLVPVDDAHYAPHTEYWDARDAHLALPPYWYFMSETGRRILRAYGPERCMWGGNFPAELWHPELSCADHLALLRDEICATEAERQAVLAETPLRVWFPDRA